jgi:hypothetical protein
MSFGFVAFIIIAAGFVFLANYVKKVQEGGFTKKEQEAMKGRVFITCFVFMPEQCLLLRLVR